MLLGVGRCCFLRRRAAQMYCTSKPVVADAC